MKFAALGRNNWMYDTICLCAERGHTPVLIGTGPASPEYRRGPEDFERLAGRYRCRYFYTTRINTAQRIQEAAESGAEVALSVNWMTLIGGEYRRQFPHGIINAHAGDLPRFRGNAAPNWAIISDEPHVVLTLHRMVDELDAGEILLQRKHPLEAQTTISEIYRFLDTSIPEMFAELLDHLEGEGLRGRVQSSRPEDWLRCLPRRPEDSCVDWNRTAIEIDRLIRASCEPFGGAYSFYEGERIILWRARPQKLPFPHLGIPGQVVRRDSQTGEVLILTGDGLIVLEEVETARDGRCAPAAVIRSTRDRLGMMLEEEVLALKERICTLESELATWKRAAVPSGDAVSPGCALRESDGENEAA